MLRNIEEGEERDELIEALEPAETARLVAEMKSDDAADLLLELDEKEKAEVLRHVPRAEREELQRLTAYSEDSAGGIMQTELVKVRDDQTRPRRRRGDPPDARSTSASCTRSS